MTHSANASGKPACRRLAALMVCALASLSFVGAQAAEQSLSPIGSFGTIRFSGEHCDGYSIDLWRSGRKLLGLIQYCAGLADTRSVGLINEISAEGPAEAIAFKAKLTTGMDYIVGGTEAPSQDLWSFRGTVHDGVLAGALSQTDQLYPQRPPRILKLRLRRRNKALDTFRSEQDWTSWADGVLLNHGPKW